MNTPKVLFHQFYTDSSPSIGHLKSTTLHLYFYKLYLQTTKFSIQLLKFQTKTIYKFSTSIPALYKCQNLPYSNECGTEFLKPTAMQLAFILSPSQSIYFFSHHHLLILLFSIVYKLYVIHEHSSNLFYVLDESLNSPSVLRESLSD